MNEARATFAGYRLDQLLATDTVSSTYRATPPRQRDAATRAVALRITHPLRTSGRPDVDAIAAYISSVSAALNVSHPALVPIVDAGDVDDRVYVATALIDGVTLGQHVRDRGRLSSDDAVALLHDLAVGLDRAHAAGIIHGAISPRTIQIRGMNGGRSAAVLRGFGIDALLGRQARVDRDRIDLHDVEYVAPEQLRGLGADGRTDQYALACALYHCVAGRPPFVRETVTAMFGAHLLSPVPPVPDDVDRPLSDALDVGLRKEPAARHASCVDVLRGPRNVRTGDRRAGAGAPAGDRRPVVVAWPDDREHGAVPTATAAMAGARPTRRRGLRLGGDRWPTLAWPVATMLILSGIISTLTLAAVLREWGLTGAVGSDRGRLAAGALAAAGDTPVSAGVRWQRTLTDEALYALEVTGDTVVAAAPHSVIALDRSRGTTRWRHGIDVGVLTDMAVTDDVVALRAATFRALSVAGGTLLWDKADIVAPISSLAAVDGVIYGLGSGRLTPEVVALEAATGAPMWQFDGGPDRIDDDAAVAAIDGTVALLDGDAVSVIDPDPAASRSGGGGVTVDRVRWRTDVADPWLDSLAVVPDAVVVATHSGDVCAYDPADGEQRWCAAVDGLAEQSPTVVADGDAIVVLLGSKVTTLALESGATRWSFDAPRTLTPIVASSGRQVIVSDVTGRAHGLDLERGFEGWRASGFGEITALLATEDAVYAGTRDGVIVRLEPPADGVPS